MTMKAMQKHLSGILKDLDKAATFFEQLGLTTQSDVLDKAAGEVEELREVAKDLQKCCA